MRTILSRATLGLLVLPAMACAGESPFSAPGIQEAPRWSPGAPAQLAAAPSYAGRLPPEIYPLGPDALAMLARLREEHLEVEVRVWIGAPPEDLRERFQQQRHRVLVGQLLAAFAHRAPGIRVRWLDPVQEASLAASDGVDREGTVILERGGSAPRRRTRVYLDDLEVEVVRSVTDRTRMFRGEESLVSALGELLDGTPPCVCFAQGHGEGSPQDPGEAGFSRSTTALQLQGYRVEPRRLPFAAGAASGCAVVVMAGPREELGEDELRGLSSHLGEGRPLYLLLDWDSPARGLRRILRPLGLDLIPNVLVEPDPDYQVGGDQELALLDLNGHFITFPLMRQGATVAMAGTMALEYSATAQRAVDVRTLLQTSPSSWGAVGAAPSASVGPGPEDLVAPLSAAVAVSSRLGANDALELKGADELRFSVAGDSRFASNRGAVDASGNLPFFLGTIRWLTREPPRVTIPARLVSSLVR